MEIDKRLCCYCGTCANICPQEAIELLDKGEVVINEERCAQCPCIRWPCGLCIKSCPVGAIGV
ncbi:MAG: 4Fe-4S binding protein [Candidatus Hydrothermarchaeales archaeon]